MHKRAREVAGRLAKPRFSANASRGQRFSRAANRYEKIVFVTKVGREYENTKAHPKSTNIAQV